MGNCTEDYLVCSSLTEEIGYMYIIPVICSFGVVCNIIILIVFFKPSFRSHMTSSTLTYLTGLAVADLLTAFVFLPIGLIRCIETTSHDARYAFNWYEKYLYRWLGNTFMTISVWTTLTITTERYLFLLYHGGEVSGQSMQRSAAGALTILAFIYILACGFNIPMFFYYDTVTGYDILDRSDFAKGTGYEAYSWIRMFVVKYIPMTLIAILNVALIKLMRNSRRSLKIVIFPMAVYARRIQAQNRVTAMLLSISTVFVVCNSLEPFIHASIYSTLFGECSLETREYETARMFGNMFETISYASNFVTYCVFNQVFLSQVKQLFGRKPRKIENGAVMKMSTVTSTHQTNVSVFCWHDIFMASFFFTFQQAAQPFSKLDLIIDTSRQKSFICSVNTFVSLQTFRLKNFLVVKDRIDHKFMDVALASMSDARRNTPM